MALVHASVVGRSYNTPFTAFMARVEWDLCRRMDEQEFDIAMISYNCGKTAEETETILNRRNF